MPKDVVELKNRAINSLTLGIELFNRPHNQGRAEGVLIFLHHAFEMLLKAAIKKETGSVHVKGGKFSYSFNKCLEMAQNEIKVISPDNRKFLSILDAHRDIAIHYYQDVSEDLLYTQTQAAVALFVNLLNGIFKECLGDLLPERVLPVSTRPPKDLPILIGSEFCYVDELLRSGNRKGPQAIARLRSIMHLTTVVRDKDKRITEAKLRRAVSLRQRGEEWNVIFPEIAQLELNTQGVGTPFHIRIDKSARFALRVVENGEPADGTLFKQEVDIGDKYNMGLHRLAKNLGQTPPKTGALITELKILENPECFRLLVRGPMKFKAYSKKALDLLRQAIKDGIDIKKVWEKHRPRPKVKKRQ